MTRNNVLAAFDTFAQLATRKSPKGMDEKSRYYLRKHLNEYMDTVTDSIDRMSFIRYILALPQSQSTKYIIANRLGRFLHWYGLLDTEDYSIVRKSFPQKVNSWSHQTLTADMIPKILAEVEKSNRSYYTRARNMLMIYLLATIGMRISQLLEMEINDLWVDKDKVFIRIARKKDIYGKREKTEKKSIALDHTIGDYKLEVLLKEFYDARIVMESDILFCSNKNKQISYQYARNFIHKIGQRVGIDKLSPHSFRHFVGTTVANKYGIMRAAVLLGHTDIHTTQKYINPDYVDTSVSLPQWED